jgi:hypothetical protein
MSASNAHQHPERPSHTLLPGSGDGVPRKVALPDKALGASKAALIGAFLVPIEAPAPRLR